MEPHMIVGADLAPVQPPPLSEPIQLLDEPLPVGETRAIGFDEWLAARGDG